MAAVLATLATGAAAAEPRYEWLRLDSHHVKWGSPRAGTGSEVTYAYVTASRHTADARNCRDLVSLDGLLERSRVSRAVLEQEAEAAFAMWEAAAGIRFRRVADEDSAQILIGAQAKPQGIAFADVASGAEGLGGVRSIRRSMICLNPQKPWKVGFGGDVSVYDLRYAIAHEAGHAIGLDHPSPSGQLMSFRYDEQFRELQPGDIAGALALYGPPATTVAASRQSGSPPQRASAGAPGGCPPPTGAPTAAAALALRSAGCPADE